MTYVQLPNVGGYSVAVTDTSGSVTSRVARLEVDPTFTMITAGPVVTDTGTSVNAAWGDYDNDGFVDMMVANGEGVASFKNFLFHNQGNGTFSKVTANLVDWTSLTNLVTTNMTMPVMSLDTTQARQSYFRAIRQ